MIGQPISFKFIANKGSTIHQIATQDRFFLAKQTLVNFGKHEWIPFEGVTNKSNLHDFINEISEKQIEIYNNNPSGRGAFEPLTATGTKQVEKNYLQNFEMKNVAGKTVFEALETSFMLTAADIGKGFWVEAFNYKPEWKKDQGVIIVGVQDPKVVSFYAEKRTITEKKIKGVTGDKIETSLPCEQVYANILDIYINIHTRNKNFPINLSVVNTDSAEEIVLHNHIFSETSFTSRPTSIGNIITIEEISLLPQWIKKIAHEPSEEGTIKNFIIRLELDLSNVEDSNNECCFDNIVKEISFTINYKDEWSVEEDDEDWVAQIAEIKEATLVSQENEECGFTSIKIIDDCNPFYILKSDKGVLTTNNTTPILEYVAGGNNNSKTITIELEKVETAECQQKAGFNNTEDNGKTHINNTFNTLHLPTKIVQSDLFGTISPVKIISENENKITLELTFPYEADNKLDIFINYLFSDKYIEFPLIIQSCRYIRTPVIRIYADIEWILKLSVASLKPEAYNYANMSDSIQTRKHNGRSRAAAINKNSKTQEVIFELDLDAYYNNDNHDMVSGSYENKKMLEVIVSIKKGMDSITGVDGSRASKSITSKLKKRLLKTPITFQLDFPVISIEGSWKNGQISNGIVEKEGSIKFGFTPLIKGAGKIDGMALAELLPAVGTALKALNLVAHLANIDFYFNFCGYGKISLTGEIHFNKEDDFALESETSVGIAVEFGVKAGASTKKLTFRAQEMRDEVKLGFEFGGKVDTSITFVGKAGNEAKGPFIEMEARFNGIEVFVTARVQTKRWSYGPKDEPYVVMEKPKEPLCKKRWYLLENN
ncbi:hypothetical protein [Tenacibaculum finnmarkense]|uniref:hypothetical protein n=1 Tax=Tenacibaculum finnmarkense TaxID=2781243 RepID=UPI001EFA5A5E|nr:hypothetical protein [Tenacibaculum finnmarkense]MCG8913886.1 hypothetical protein [Tenacibaculum finnmarkense]